MRKRLTGLFLSAAFSAACLAQQPGATTNAQQQQPAQGQSQQKPATPPQTHLKIGDLAPDFALRDTNGKEVKLSDYRGKSNVVLAFYVLAFTGG